ncbi:MAG: ferredoxin--NADP reductase [Candidatus Omnitrophota bacterium]
MTFESEISEIIPQTHDVKSFRIPLPEDVPYEAGQYMIVTIRIDGKEHDKPFTISCSPTQKGYVEFTKKITDHTFSQALDQMKGGEWVRIDMPKGKFTLERGGEKIAFLSGGIGITPIHSMCRYAADRDLPVDMILLYGNHMEQDIVFQKDLERLQSRHANFRIVYTLDKPQDPGSWLGETGYIDADMIKKHVPDYDQRMFFICGPPAMVKKLKGILQDQIGLDEEKIVTENFSGY